MEGAGSQSLMTRIWRTLSSKPVNQVGITGRSVAETVSTLEKTLSTLENSVSTLDFSNVLTVFFFCGSRIFRWDVVQTSGRRLCKCAKAAFSSLPVRFCHHGHRSAGSQLCVVVALC